MVSLDRHDVYYTDNIVHFLRPVKFNFDINALENIIINFPHNAMLVVPGFDSTINYNTVFSIIIGVK